MTPFCEIFDRMFALHYDKFLWGKTAALMVPLHYGKY